MEKTPLFLSARMRWRDSHPRALIGWLITQSEPVNSSSYEQEHFLPLAGPRPPWQVRHPNPQHAVALAPVHSEPARGISPKRCRGHVHDRWRAEMLHDRLRAARGGLSTSVLGAQRKEHGAQRRTAA